jgi:hypothetical protein
VFDVSTQRTDWDCFLREIFWLIIAQGEAEMRQKHEAKPGSAEKTVRDIQSRSAKSSRRRFGSRSVSRVQPNQN